MFLIEFVHAFAGASCRSVRWWEAHHVAEVGAVSREPFAKTFYKSGAWMKCRRAYASSKGNLCERCWSAGLIVPGDEVHHKVKLTPENITDPAVTLNWDNLELLCKDCHMKEHQPKRWRTDELGHIEL